MTANRTWCAVLSLSAWWAAVAGGQAVPVMQSTFTGGELSPLAAARVDSERYYASVQTLENMIAIPQGPAVRRPGTRFVAATDANHVGRLTAWKYSSDDAYTLEWTDSTMRVFRSHGLVTNGDDSIYELATPFDANEIGSIQYWQSADVCYLVDGTDWPQKLTRADHNDWTIADANIQDGPFLTENTTAATIAASAVSGTDVDLVTDGALFQAGHVGSYWRLRDVVATTTTAGNFASETDSDDLLCQAGKQFQWVATGAFVGTVELRFSTDSGVSWTPYTVVNSSGVLTTGTQVFDNDTGQDILVDVACSDYTSGSAAYQLWVYAYMHVGVVKVTAVTDANNAVGTVVRTLASTAATTRWSEGAWSGVRGYPRAIATYGDRLVLASTTYQPLTIWMSKTGSYESFDTGEGDAADAMAWTLARAQQNPILWIAGQKRRGLLVGSTGAVYDLEPEDNTVAIRPNNPPAVVGTLGIPCAATAPVLADNIVLVLQRGGRKVREVLYSYDSDSLVAPDLTLMSEHVTAGGVTAMAWTSQPYPVLWCARADGQVAAMTYDRNYQIVSWSRHAPGGSGVVESLCVVPSTDQDELWWIVRRTIDGSTVRYVEYMAPWSFGEDQKDAYFVDCGLSYDAAAATTFSGLDHLEGQTAAVLADGASVSGLSVASGAVTLPYAASVVHAGLPFVSTLKTVRYDFSGQNGVTWHRRKAIGQVTVSFFETLGAKVGPTSALAQAMDWQSGTAGVLTGGVMPLFTGDKDLSLTKSFATDAATVSIVQDQPLPLTVRAIVALIGY